mmetsp:Transcript_79225/g.177173  ORF Transcript_79225/g.177173 Transcript_79225/m.177173 type:complete len:95 (-) Transcript_79225:108-392(-)
MVIPQSITDAWKLKNKVDPTPATSSVRRFVLIGHCCMLCRGDVVPKLVLRRGEKSCNVLDKRAEKEPVDCGVPTPAAVGVSRVCPRSRGVSPGS